MANLHDIKEYRKSIYIELISNEMRNWTKQQLLDYATCALSIDLKAMSDVELKQYVDQLLYKN